jgi:hypothetical protein
MPPERIQMATNVEQRPSLVITSKRSSAADLQAAATGLVNDSWLTRFKAFRTRDAILHIEGFGDNHRRPLQTPCKRSFVHASVRK